MSSAVEEFRERAAASRELYEAAMSERDKVFWRKIGRHYDRLAEITAELRDHQFEPFPDPGRGLHAEKEPAAASYEPIRSNGGRPELPPMPRL